MRQESSRRWSDARPLSRRTPWEDRALLPVIVGNQLAFFQTAATLIPLLLFGGVVAERLQPESSHGEGDLWNIGWGIAFVGCYAIAAEIFAIDAVVTGEWATWTEIFVTLFVVGGMCGVVFVLVRPWYNELKGRGESSEPRAKRLKVVAIVTIGGIAIWGGFEMLSNVDRAGESQRLEATTAVVSQKATEVTAIKSRTLALSIALARAQRQLTVAKARGESGAVLNGFTVESKTLDASLSRERRIENMLSERLRRLRVLERSLVQGG